MKQNKKIVSYDAEADVLAVYLQKGKADDSYEVAPGVVVEVNKQGSIIGVEILNALKMLQRKFRARALSAGIASALRCALCENSGRVSAAVLRNSTRMGPTGAKIVL